MKKYLKAFFGLLKATMDGYVQSTGSMLAAGLSYYAIFSLTPLLIVSTSLGGIIFSESEIVSLLVRQVSHTVGPRAADALQSVWQMGHLTENLGLYTSLSLVLMAILASMLFTHLKRAINALWGITSQPGQSFFLFVRTQTLSVVMVVVVVMMLLSFMFFSTVVVSVNQWLRLSNLDIEPVLTHADIALTFMGFMVLFAIFYKLLPDAQIELEDVLIGAAFTSLLFTMGEVVIGLYLSRVTLSGVYGAAGSIVVILAWVYYSMQIFLYGAKFTQVYADTYGSKVRPSKKAARAIRKLVTHEELFGGEQITRPLGHRKKAHPGEQARGQ